MTRRSLIAALGVWLAFAVPAGAAWPGGNGRIVFSSGGDLWTDAGRLTATAQEEAQASWSPDGSRLAFRTRSTTGEPYHVAVMDADGSDRIDLPGGAFNETQPGWSPDGTQIVYRRSVVGDVNSGDVWLMNADGSNTHQLTHTHAGIYPAAWSANGDRILAAYPASHNGKLYAVDVTTGDARALTGFVGDLFAQGLSRNGKTVLAAIGCGGTATPYGLIETIPFAGGQPNVIVRGPCRATWTA